MVRVATTAKFPATPLALADIGLFTNREDADLVTDLTAGATTVSVDDASQFAIGMWLSTVSENGFELVQITAVDLALNTVTVGRAKDGTVAVAHVQGQTFKATLPAVALNQMRDDLIAHAVFLTPTGGAWTPGSVLFIGATGNLAQDNTNLFWDDANNELQVANLDVDTGVFQVGGTTVFENDRDFAINLIPDADVTRNIGSPSRRFLTVYSPQFFAYNSSDGDIGITIRRASATGRAQLLLESEAGTDIWRFGVTGAGASTFSWFDSAGAATRMSLSLAGQLTVDTVGSAAGLLLGGDAQWYRGAADRMDLASGDSLNIVLGALQIAGTTVFESDRDVAVDLLPNAIDTLDLGSAARRWAELHVLSVSSGHILPIADNTYDLGSASLRWRDVYASGSSFRVYAAAGDANPSARLGSNILALGPGGGTAPDVELTRGAANRLDLAAGDSLNILNGTMTQVVNADGNIAYTINRFSATGRAMIALRDELSNQVWRFGMTGAGSTTFGFFDQTQNALSMAQNGDMTLSPGGIVNCTKGFQIGSVLLFEADRDLATTLIPNADSTLALGSSARRYTSIFAQAHDVLNAASDANPLYRLGTSGLAAGPGGATAPNAFLERVVPTANVLWHLGAAAGGATGVWVDVTTPGIILRAPDNNYWRLTIENTGALTTTSIGASLP